MLKNIHPAESWCNGEFLVNLLSIKWEIWVVDCLMASSSPMKQFSLISEIAAPFQCLTQIHCIIFFQQVSNIQVLQVCWIAEVSGDLFALLAYGLAELKCNLISRFNATSSVGKSICLIKADFVADNQVPQSSRTFSMDCHSFLSGFGVVETIRHLRWFLINWLAFLLGHVDGFTTFTSGVWCLGSFFRLFVDLGVVKVLLDFLDVLPWGTIN